MAENIFNPPESDIPKRLGQKDKIPAYIFIDPDDPTVIFVRTCGKAEILDNSIYELNIPNFAFDDGEVINKFKQEFVTKLEPCYVDVEDVLTLCSSIPIDTKDILMHIRMASEIANYWAYRENENELHPIKFTKNNLKDDYYPFYMFIRYRAAAEAIKEFYIGAVTRPSEYKDELSDLAREEKMDLSAIKKLLDSLNDEADEWLELLVVLTADPQWALRGKYSYAISMEMFKPYHQTYVDKKGGPWNRGY